MEHTSIDRPVVSITQDRKGYFENHRYELTVELTCSCGHVNVLRTDVTHRELTSAGLNVDALDILINGVEEMQRMHVAHETVVVEEIEWDKIWAQYKNQ